MEILSQFIDIVLHLDKHLALLVAQYGIWIYAILFAIIFCETGLVVTPFLPGDSLLFVAGALAATAAAAWISGILIAVLLSAAVLGDNINYWIGRWFGLQGAALGRRLAALLQSRRLRQGPCLLRALGRHDHDVGPLHAVRAHLRALRRRRRAHDLSALFRSSTCSAASSGCVR